MKALLTAQEEDELSRLLSDLTPMAYYQLLKKVDRSKWHVMGYNAYSSKTQDKIKKP